MQPSFANVREQLRAPDLWFDYFVLWRPRTISLLLKWDSVVAPGLHVNFACDIVRAWPHCTSTLVRAMLVSCLEWSAEHSGKWTHCNVLLIRNYKGVRRCKPKRIMIRGVRDEKQFRGHLHVSMLQTIVNDRLEVVLFWGASFPMAGTSPPTWLPCRNHL